jgi:hypothetical protein
MVGFLRIVKYHLRVAQGHAIAVPEGARRAQSPLVDKRAIPASHIDEDVFSGIGPLDHGVIARNQVILQNDRALAAASQLPGVLTLQWDVSDTVRPGYQQIGCCRRFHRFFNYRASWRDR